LLQFCPVDDRIFHKGELTGLSQRYLIIADLVVCLRAQIPLGGRHFDTPSLCPSSREFSALIVGRTPWSARDALVPLVPRRIRHLRSLRSRPGGRLRTRASAPPSDGDRRNWQCKWHWDVRFRPGLYGRSDLIALAEPARSADPDGRVTFRACLGTLGFQPDAWIGPFVRSQA
jgi:hypothetical protein